MFYTHILYQYDCIFFFNDTATTEIYTLSLHDALPIAVEALDKLRLRRDSLLVFPNARGGYLDVRNFNRRHWKPVQKAAGIEPLRELYDPAPHLCHLRTPRRRPGVRPLTVHGYEHRDDRPHYGHLAVDSHEHAVSLLDALALERAVDAGWTSNWRPVRPGSDSVSRHRGRRSRRVVDARWTSKSEAITTSAARGADEQELLRAL